MNAQLNFRGLLLKIQDLLSDADRQRLHFLFGDDVPRCLRDDPSAGGALRVLESLFDKAMINDQDCDYLIEAFKKIHCLNAAQKLQEYQQTQKQGTNKNFSLQSILMENNEEDKICTAEPPLKKPSDGICATARWIRSGVTVAGGNDSGSDLDHLNSPDGLFVDEYATIYVVDRDNNRIVKWPSGAKSGQLVAGGKGPGNGTDQLNYPLDAVVDENGTIYVTDYKNDRVQQWPQGAHSGRTILADRKFIGIGQDDEGSLYTSDETKMEIRKWQKDDTVANRLENNFQSPDRLYVDQNHSVYVVDRNNHLVLKIVKGQDSVTVGGSKGANDNQLSSPHGVTADKSGNIYVADTDNHRIMRWLLGATSGTLIVGGRNKGFRSDQLNRPTDLQFDRCGNLYVADSGNSRVQKFLLDMSSC